jgi:serine/threonine protein kinase
VTLKKLGRYELLRVLGKGAMGVVYEGRDPNLDRRVAIKTVKVENLSEEAAAEYEHRFRTEARSAARLQHPNIVSVYDSDRDADVAFLVMEYIQGDDLKHHLDRGVRYSLEQSLKIVRDLLSALDYAHKQGIVHRDIKPANLLIEPGGRVKLTDFGVARIQDSGEATRTQGSMIGTLKYMAPEQVQGQKIDSRADLFSVGVVLYQLLTDKRPFDGDNDFSIIHQIIGHVPAAPSSINPRLPTALDAVVARALAKDRDERFATARDFAVALQAAIRRAEDQTVVPPLNPMKRVEIGASRPLTTPGGSAPGGLLTMPPTVTSVTQELELVYWKDVKDSTEAEELQGFLDKFPAGIYADLARRRLRRLGGEPTNVGAPTNVGLPTPTNIGAPPYVAAPPSAAPAAADLGTSGTSTMFPQYDDVTRVRDSSRPLAPGDTTQQLRPADFVDQEYTRAPADFTRTLTQPREPVPPPAASSAPPAASSAPPAASSAPAAAPKPAASPAPAAGKKRPLAVLAGIGALAVAGIVLAMSLRGEPPQVPDAAVAAGSDVAATAAAPSAEPPPAPVDAAPVPAAAAPVAAAPASAEVVAAAATASARAAATPARRAASQPRPARPSAAAPEPSRPAAAAPLRVEPEPPRPLPAPVAAASPVYNAVETCRDKFFLSKELCLAEHCDKAGARNHPLCVKRRDEIRLREESKVRQGPQ